MGNIIQVGMADYKLARPPDKLMTAGLGSCIGICLLDQKSKIAGMSHIMLPYSQEDKNLTNHAKYADTAVIAVLAAMEEMDADTRHLVAKIAGGAQMFQFAVESDILRIGERNALAVESILKKSKIKLLNKDIGGHVGRTITFDPATGDLHIRTIKHGEKII